MSWLTTWDIGNCTRREAKTHQCWHCRSSKDKIPETWVVGGHLKERCNYRLTVLGRDLMASWVEVSWVDMLSLFCACSSVISINVTSLYWDEALTLIIYTESKKDRPRYYSWWCWSQLMGRQPGISIKRYFNKLKGFGLLLQAFLTPQW